MDAIEIKIKGTETDKDVDESANGEEITYVAISPDGFDNDTSISIKKVATNEETNTFFDRKCFHDGDEPLGWSLAVSDIIDNDTDDIEQFRLSLIPSKGTIKLIKFSFKNNSHYDDNDNNKSTYHRGGGVVSFLKNSKNSSKNSATLICMNCTKIRKINIKITYENISASEGGAYLLPENLFNELDNIKDGSCKLKYLLKSRWQEFLIIKTKDYQDYQHKQCIGLYNINTLQLVNIFSVCSVCSMSKNELGIFAISTGSKSTGSISTDSRLFAYSYGDNTIAIYLMESGLEVVQKRFNDINKIKFLEFNKEDKELIIIEDKNGDMKFHIWVLSGCLNDHLVIDNTSILSNYDYDHCLAKANGVVVFLNNENNIESLHNSSNSIIKSVESDLKDFDEDLSKTFKRFRDLCFRINYEDKPEFDKDMATNIKIACRFLAYLYDDNDGIDRGKSIDSNHQELVNETIKFIKSFIKYFPNHWKLMEHNKEDGYLHRPQNKYVTYPYYDLDLKLRDEDLKSANDLELTLKCRQGRDAVMLAYLLEYYSRNFMECSHIGWMINVTKILPKLSADYMESLYYLYFNKSHFGKMKYNFPIRRKILLPPGYKNLDYKGHKSFLYIESKDIIFDNPFVEAVMTSRWRQAKIYWMIPLIFYIIFLFLFSFLSQLYLSDNDDKNKHNATLMTVVGIFYYVGIYLLAIEFMEIRKYKIKYLSLFNVFDLCSIILGVIVFTLIFVKSFNEVNEINNERIVILLTVTTLILWIEMVCIIIITKREIPENPFNTIWDAILSAYYWNAIDLSGYNYWPLKLLAFIANVILVLVLLNMIIALMNDAFNKAKEDGNLGLVTFRAELIDEYERLDNSFFTKLLHSNSPYICFHQNHDIMEKWIKKTKKKFKDIKLYSLFDDDKDD
ncbi:hypothetical protein RhiirC2_789785 [Rhizophagus irregularis]|uniref:Ion transport domain-containing protein n=1 Tax=Rhizophagus irregularis TaxID=588596 RepID=A0A2N1MMG2_9GLOM|nr:hypothetical protein RhiirC2_789785 [Rhizophagus irregularis]